MSFSFSTSEGSSDSNSGNPNFFATFLENRQKEEENQTKLLETGYKHNQDYLNELTSKLKGSEEMDMRVNRLLELDNVPTPALNATMEFLGIPKALFSADAEEADKISNDMTKNVQEFYGSRVLQTEFHAFLRSIPTLNNSAEGRKRIAENLKRFTGLKRLEYNTARSLELDYESKKKPLPASFRRNVYDQMKPAAEQIANEFSQANKQPLQSSPKPVPEGKVRVKLPDGTTGTMKKEMYDQALKDGEKYELVK